MRERRCQFCRRTMIGLIASGVVGDGERQENDEDQPRHTYISWLSQ